MVKIYKERHPEETCERFSGTYRNETIFASCPTDRRQYKREEFIPATATGGCKHGETSQTVCPWFLSQTDDFSVIFLSFKQNWQCSMK